MTGELNRHFKEIDKKLLGLSKKERAAILKEHRGNVASFLEDHPDATVKEIETCFGTPVQVAENFLHMSDFQQTERTVRMKRKLLIAICTVLGVLVAAAVIAGTVYVADIHSYTHGYGEYSPPISGPSESNPNAIATY